ncbi:MAG: acyltransferase [Anaerolineales bacterium]|nr:acyltransferase [Anaerolineales bacterium]
MILFMIPGLDGLRAIAFLLVFGFHTEYLEFGWVGVQLFFVLSGFLITNILVKMKDEYGPRDYFVKFYGRRFLRIFPLYYFYLVLVLGLTFFFINIGYKTSVMKLFQEQLPYALTYIYNFHYASADYRHLNFLVHFWSLSVEEQFYIFWPLFIFLTPKQYRKSFFVFVALFGPVARFFMDFVFRGGLFSSLNPMAPMALYPITFNHLDAFAFGALLTVFRIPKPRLQFVILTILLPVAAFLWQFVSVGDVSSLQSLGYSFLMPVGYQFVWGYSALNYYFAVLVFAVVSEGAFTDFLNNKVLRYLGKISYGLYVYHNGVLWFAYRLRDFGVGEEYIKPISALVTFLTTLLLASLTYYLVEKPLLNLKDQFFPTSGKN